MSGTEHPHRTAQELGRTLAQHVANRLRRAVDQRGHATLVVSGGTTPLPFLRALRLLDLPWHKIWVTLADDRWVPTDDARSNEGMVRRELIAHEARRAHLVGLVGSEATPQEGAAACSQRLAALPRPFDAVVLGMGADGHFASLFPGAEATPAALDPDGSATCVAVDPPGDLEPRISLTLATLLDSRFLFLHITGKEKWAVYRAALTGSADDLPVASLLRHAPRGVAVFWSP